MGEWMGSESVAILDVSMSDAAYDQEIISAVEIL